MSNSRARKHEMPVGVEWQKILRFSLPLIFGQLFHQIYHAVDGIVVGRYVSQAALAAVGACMPLTMLFFAFAMGLSAGAGIMVARYNDTKKYADVRKTSATALIVLGILGLFMTLFAWFGAKFLITNVLNIHVPEVRDMAIRYFQISSLGIWAIFLYDCMFSMVRPLGGSKTILFFMSLSALVNLVLDIIFVVPLDMGITGAAIATVLTNIMSLLLGVIYMRKNYELLRFPLRELKIDVEKARMIFHLALPAVFQQVIMAIGTLFVHRAVNSFGEETMVAFTVGSRVDGFLFCAVFGFNHIVSHLTGQNIESGRMERVKRTWLHGVLLTSVVTLITASAMYVFADEMTRLFGVSGEALHQSVDFICHNSMFFLLFAINGITLAVMHGADDVVFTTSTLILSFAVRVVATYICAYALNLGYESLWLTIPFGWIVSAVLGHIRYFSGAWKKKAPVLLAHHHSSDHMESYESLEELEEHFYE